MPAAGARSAGRYPLDLATLGDGVLERLRAAGTPFFYRHISPGADEPIGETIVNIFLRKLRSAWRVMVQVHRERAVGMLEFELKELENIFTLLLLGGFVGLPSPPAPIAIELLPLLEREIAVMLSRSDLAQDPIGALMGMLEVD